MAKSSKSSSTEKAAVEKNASKDGEKRSKRKDKDVGKARENGAPLDMESKVIYLGRIPHGFYEHQMHGYFSQFGRVKRLRLSRNPRTGASRHYAFLEFESAAVARIVAQTMHNYLLFGHLLQCRVVPRADVHPSTFKGAGRGLKTPRRETHSKRHSQWMSSGDVEQIKAKVDEMNAKHTERMKAKAEKLRALGIDYDVSIVPTRVISIAALADPKDLERDQPVEEDWELEYAEELANLSE